MIGETVDREVEEFVRAEVETALTICSRVGLDSISSDDVVAVAQVIAGLQERIAELESIVSATRAYLRVKKSADNRLPELVELKRLIGDRWG